MVEVTVPDIRQVPDKPLENVNWLGNGATPQTVLTTFPGGFTGVACGAGDTLIVLV
jgi:hypothetical protein